MLHNPLVLLHDEAALLASAWKKSLPLLTGPPHSPADDYSETARRQFPATAAGAGALLSPALRGPRKLRAQPGNQLAPGKHAGQRCSPRRSCSLTDKTLASEAEDSGSIPDGSTSKIKDPGYPGKLPRQISSLMCFDVRRCGSVRTRKSQLPPVSRGRRTAADSAGGRWRMSIREIEQRDGPYRYKTFMVQGWKENGKWRRRRFKSRADAEAFIASKSLENVTDSVGLRPVVTTLAADMVRQAENAVTILAAIGLPSMPSLVEAATHYAIHLRTTQAVEAVPLRDARKACQSDKEARGVLRARSAKQRESSLRLFEDWLLTLPRYRGQAVDPDWTPPVSEITSADIAAYIDSLRGKGGLIAAPKTRRNVLGDLQNFFNWCLGVKEIKSITTRRRWHSLNHTAGITAKKPASRTPDVLSVAQSRDLMRHVETCRDGYLVTFFALALFAGIRPGPDGELRKLAENPHRDKPCREAG